MAMAKAQGERGPACLLDLPTEVLQRVATMLSADDRAHFAAVCHRTKAAVQGAWRYESELRLPTDVAKLFCGGDEQRAHAVVDQLRVTTQADHLLHIAQKRSITLNERGGAARWLVLDDTFGALALRQGHEGAGAFDRLRELDMRYTATSGGGLKSLSEAAPNLRTLIVSDQCLVALDAIHLMRSVDADAAPVADWWPAVADDWRVHLTHAGRAFAALVAVLFPSLRTLEIHRDAIAAS